MKIMSLEGAWELAEAGLADGPEAAIEKRTAWIPARVPGDVKDALCRAGRIGGIGPTLVLL